MVNQIVPDGVLTKKAANDYTYDVEDDSPLTTDIVYFEKSWRAMITIA